MKTLQRIRQKITEKDYYISDHAEEEMIDDELERVDIENAIITEQKEQKGVRSLIFLFYFEYA